MGANTFTFLACTAVMTVLALLSLLTIDALQTTSNAQDVTAQRRLQREILEGWSQKAELKSATTTSSHTAAFLDLGYTHVLTKAAVTGLAPNQYWRLEVLQGDEWTAATSFTVEPEAAVLRGRVKTAKARVVLSTSEDAIPQGSAVVFGTIPYNVGLNPGRVPWREREEDYGVKIDHLLIFETVNDLNTAEHRNKVQRILRNDREVIVNMEFTGREPILSEIVKGSYNSTLASYAGWLRAGNHEVSLRPLHEFNGDWYPWGAFYKGGGDRQIEQFKQAWRIIVDIFRRAKAPVKFQLSYNRSNAANNNDPLQKFYPGDSWVDMVTVSSYNRACTSPYHEEWETFADGFRDFYKEVTSFTNKPLGVGETSSTSCRGDKAQWIRDAFDSIVNEFPNVVLISWFLENKSGWKRQLDWDLNTEGQKDAFAEGVRKMRRSTPGGR